MEDAPVAAPMMVANLRSVTVCMSSRAALDDGRALGMTDAVAKVADNSARATTGSKVLATRWYRIPSMAVSLGGGQVLEDLETACQTTLRFLYYGGRQASGGCAPKMGCQPKTKQVTFGGSHGHQSSPRRLSMPSISSAAHVSQGSINHTHRIWLDAPPLLHRVTLSDLVGARN